MNSSSAASTAAWTIQQDAGPDRPLVAAAILPVVMIVQVLFSVPIAVANPDRYEPLDGPRQLSVFFRPINTDNAEADQSDRPMRIAAVISALTLTYYADACLRSFSSQVAPVDGAFVYCVKSIGLLIAWTVIFYVISCLFLRNQSRFS